MTDFKKLKEEYDTKKYITWESKIKVKSGDICNAVSFGNLSVHYKREKVCLNISWV